MKNKELNINSSYLELCRADSFEDRHIGPSSSEINEMLDELGVNDLETLISSMRILCVRNLDGDKTNK